MFFFINKLIFIFYFLHFFFLEIKLEIIRFSETTPAMIEGRTLSDQMRRLL